MGVQGRGEVAGSPAAEIRVVTTAATEIMGTVLHFSYVSFSEEMNCLGKLRHRDSVMHRRCIYEGVVQHTGYITLKRCQKVHP